MADDSVDLLGTFNVRHEASEDLAASFDGQTSLNLAAEFIAKQEASADLLSEFEVGQGSEDLFCAFAAIHAATLELKMAFDAQGSLNIPGEFVIRRSDLLDLPAGFVILQGLRDLPAEFFIKNGNTIELFGLFLLRHLGTAIELSAEFAVRNVGSANLSASFNGQASKDLLCAFTVRQETSEALLACFTVRHHSYAGTGLIIAIDPNAFFNYSENVGTGFLSHPHYGADRKEKVAGQTSLRGKINYVSKGYDYIRFGWKYRNPVWGEDTWPGTGIAPNGPGWAPHVGGISHLNLKCEFEVFQGTTTFIDLPAQFEVMVSRVDLIAEEVLTGVEASVEFTGLDLLTHKFYRIIGEFENADVTYQVYAKMYFNGDETDGNYSAQYQNEEGSFQDHSAPRIGVFSTNQHGKFELIITRDPSGYLNWAGIGLVGARNYLRMSGRYSVVQANLTTIKFVTERVVPGTPGTGFKTGSYFQIYGYVA